jgi:hypothetical protein
MHRSRTTLTLEPSLVRRAARFTGFSEKTALVRMGLEALPARENARRLPRRGTLRHRENELTLLRALSEAEAAEHEEVMRVVERERPGNGMDRCASPGVGALVRGLAGDARPAPLADRVRPGARIRG